MTGSRSDSGGGVVSYGALARWPSVIATITCTSYLPLAASGCDLRSAALRRARTDARRNPPGPAASPPRPSADRPLPRDNDQIIAATYHRYLPTEAELLERECVEGERVLRWMASSADQGAGGETSGAPRWEEMPYAEFLEARRRRMAEIIRVAYRKLGGDEEAETVAPPWFLPDAELVWTRIAETERALRALVRTVYVHRCGDAAAARIEAALPPPEREALARALRSRPAGADPLTVVDYLYLKQLPALLFANDVWGDAKARLGNVGDLKPRLTAAIDSIAPVRNEIAHVREVSTDRLAKASVACADVLALLKA